MLKLNDIKNLTKLWYNKKGEIAKNKEDVKKANTYGCVIDISEPFMTKKYSESVPGSFVSKIKIIDETFNFMAVSDNADLKVKKYVVLNMYSEQPFQTPRIANVGDIIRLKRFFFKINQRGELMGYENEFSDWMVYDRYISENVNPKGLKKTIFDRHFSGALYFEEERIKNLRQWMNDFFSTHSLKKILWWSRIIEPQNNDSLFSGKQQNKDMILKVTEVNMDEKTIKFIDNLKQKYIINLTSSPLVKTEQVLKLRNCLVLFENSRRIIVLTQNSSCLIMGPNDFDTMMFDDEFYQKHKDMEYGDIHKSESSAADLNVDLKKLYDTWPVLVDYPTFDCMDRKFSNLNEIEHFLKETYNATLIKKDYTEKTRTSLADLRDSLDYSKAKQSDQRFVVECKIDDFNQISSDSIFQVNTDNDEISLVGANDNTNDEVKPNIVLCSKLVLYDTSVEDQDKKFDLYVTARNDNSDPFLLWRVFSLSDNSNLKISDIKEETINKINKRLDFLKNEKIGVSLVIEAKLTKNNQRFFELVDTLFLP